MRTHQFLHNVVSGRIIGLIPCCVTGFDTIMCLVTSFGEHVCSAVGAKDTTGVRFFAEKGGRCPTITI